MPASCGILQAHPLSSRLCILRFPEVTPERAAFPTIRIDHLSAVCLVGDVSRKT